MKGNRTMKLAISALFLTGAIGCSLNTPMTQREQAAGIGVLGGGAAGAIIGSVAGSALAGGLVGVPLGALAGYYYGDKLTPTRGDDRAALESDKRASVSFADVLFESDKAQIKKDAMPYVNPLVSYLKDNPTRKVWIEGHTDSVGGAAYNMELSTRRAEAVRDVLVNAGIDSKRIAVKGMGEAEPIATNNTPEGRQMNRRVDIDVF